jgi:hypothetical protein
MNPEGPQPALAWRSAQRWNLKFFVHAVADEAVDATGGREMLERVLAFTTASHRPRFFISASDSLDAVEVSRTELIEFLRSVSSDPHLSSPPPPA